jgi:hypothetical protein
MRGVNLQIEYVIVAIIILFIIVIGFMIATLYILPAQGSTGTIFEINELCGDWQKGYSCSYQSAFTVKNKAGKSLAELCAAHFNKKVDQFSEIYEKCKEPPLCAGCPKSTTV